LASLPEKNLRFIAMGGVFWTMLVLKMSQAKDWCWNVLFYTEPWEGNTGFSREGAFSPADRGGVSSLYLSVLPRMND